MLVVGVLEGIAGGAEGRGSNPTLEVVVDPSPSVDTTAVGDPGFKSVALNGSGNDIIFSSLLFNNYNYPTHILIRSAIKLNTNKSYSLE